MTNEQPSSLAFSIKEAVWLNRGNEIDELLSLSLEPDVTIKEDDDQVLVRGSLQLVGEYRPKEETNAPVDADSLEDQVSFRSVEEVSLNDEGMGVIRHHFPLDVTIPKERINRIEDLLVTVDAFDYELPGSGCIELDANVSISGITSERNAYSEQDEGEDAAETEYEAGYTEGYQHEEEDDREEQQQHYSEAHYLQEENRENSEEDVKERHFHFEAYRQQPEPEELDHNHHEEHRWDGGQHNFNDYEDTAISAEESRDIEEKSEAAGNEPNVKFSPAKSFNSLNRTPEETEHYESADSDEEVQQEKTSGQKQEENALYLTKMLTRGEERFTRLRMCIVQEGESLETIAERYNLTVSSLLRMNRLNEERVSEGQILYLPAKQAPASKE